MKLKKLSMSSMKPKDLTKKMTRKMTSGASGNGIMKQRLKNDLGGRRTYSKSGY